MKTRMLTVAGIATFLLTSLPCLAQERTLPDPEPVKPPEVKPEPIKPPTEVAPTLFPEPACEAECGIRVLWGDTLHPLCSLWPREVVTMVKQRTLVVVYKDETITVDDIVVKPQAVERQIVCTTMKEVKVTDPVTGECSTHTEPCTEVKVIKEIAYTAVRVPREVKVPIPYLKEIEIEVPRKDLLLEYRIEMVKESHPMTITDYVPPNRAFQVPDLCPQLPPLGCGAGGCAAPEK